MYNWKREGNEPNAGYRSLYSLPERTSHRVSALLEAIPRDLRATYLDAEWESRMARFASRFHPDSASLAAALAVEGPPHPIADYTAWLYSLKPSVVEDLPFALAQHLVRPDDPSGELPLGRIVQLSLLFSVFKHALSPEEVLEAHDRYVAAGSPKLPRRTGGAADAALHATLLEILRASSEAIPGIVEL